MSCDPKTQFFHLGISEKWDVIYNLLFFSCFMDRTRPSMNGGQRSVYFLCREAGQGVRAPGAKDPEPALQSELLLGSSVAKGP